MRYAHFAFLLIFCACDVISRLAKHQENVSLA